MWRLVIRMHSAFAMSRSDAADGAPRERKRRNLMEPMDPALSHVVTFVSATHAPVEDHRVAVSVPFNFVVGEQILPSGNYVITSRRKTPEFVCFGNRQKNVNIQ